MKYNKFLEILEEIAPTGEYKNIDNSGVQIYSGCDEVKKVIVCLEVNMDVIREADASGADMILTHHPLIFNPARNINYDDYPGRYIHEIIKRGMSVYSSHLSFDFAKNGNNSYIAELLSLFIDEEGSMERGYYGSLPKPMTFTEACSHVEDCLELSKHYIRCVDGGREKLVSVGFCTGAGGDYIYKAAVRGCDLFITGDLKLHEAQYAKAMNMSVIDAGHYGTEKIFTENMAKQFRAKAVSKSQEIEIVMAKSCTNPYTEILG